MKVNAPLISASPVLPDRSELTDQDPTVLLGSDFSSLLFLIVPPQDSLPITNTAGETDDAAVAAHAPGSNNRPAPLLDLQLPFSPQANNKNIRLGWHTPFTIDPFSGETRAVPAGAAANATEEGLAILSLPTEAGRVVMPEHETANRPVADFETEAGKPLVPQAIHTAAEAAPILNSAPSERNQNADSETAAKTDGAARALPPTTGKVGDLFDPKIESAVISSEANPRSAWPAKHITVNLTEQTPGMTKDGFLPAVPHAPPELVENAPAGVLSRAVEAAVSDSDNRAPATFANIAAEASGPVSASSAAKVDGLEHRSIKSEKSAHRPQGIAIDLSAAAATPQQAPARQTATVQNQELNFGGDTPDGGKAGEHLPKEQRENSHAPASFAALSAPSPEFHNSADAKPTVGPASVLHQVAGEIAKSIEGKRHEAILTLDPPELGSLKIALVVEGDKVYVHILTETRESHELLEHHLYELTQALQIQQFETVDVRVESSRFDFSGDPRQEFQQPSEERQRPEANLARFFEGDDVPAESRQVSRPPVDSDRVSMWA